MFKTPQIARLIKEFTFELRTGPSITALLGDPCTGKTRTLYEIGKKQKRNSNIRWIELSARESGDGAKQDRSDLIEATFDMAEDGDVIIVDHFESAFNKTRHQLFASWSTVGIQKKLKLVIACYSEVGGELEEIAQQYQVRIKSYQLMPFNSEQADAFVRFYLFPDEPGRKLSLPGELRVQFAVAQGKVGQLIEIAERERDRIEADFRGDSKQTRLGGRRLGGRMVAVLAVSVLAVAGGWFFLGGEDSALAPTLVTSGDSSSQAASLGPATDVGAETEPEVIEHNAEADIDPGPVEITQETSAAEVMVEPEVELVDENSGVLIPVNDDGSIKLSASAIENIAMYASVVESDTGSASDNLTDAQEQTATDQESVAVASVEQRLERELQASMDWILGSDNSVGTIQILLLSYENFDAKAYYEHVDYLASRQVDTSTLRIFKTYTASKETYSVFYGAYDSRSAAAKAKASLPEVLRKTSPIPRSVGGIMQEIRRLEARN